MSSFEMKEHNCFCCDAKEKYIICNQETILENQHSLEGITPIKPTYISKNRVELEYECKVCHNKNKIVVDL